VGQGDEGSGLTKKMPPWFADPHVGKFAKTARCLRPTSICSLAGPTPARSPANPKDALRHCNLSKAGTSASRIWCRNANEFNVASSGTIDYTYFVVPLNLKKIDGFGWRKARPGNRAVVHHIIAYVREPGSKWMKDAKPGEPFVPAKDSEGNGEFLVGYAPGTSVGSEAGPGQS